MLLLHLRSDVDGWHTGTRSHRRANAVWRQRLVRQPHAKRLVAQGSEFSQVLHSRPAYTAAGRMADMLTQDAQRQGH